MCALHKTKKTHTQMHTLPPLHTRHGGITPIAPTYTTYYANRICIAGGRKERTHNHNITYPTHRLIIHAVIAHIDCSAWEENLVTQNGTGTIIVK
jgi:hypothetical protein